MQRGRRPVGRCTRCGIYRSSSGCGCGGPWQLQLARDAGAVISYQPFEAEDISGLLYRVAGSAPVIGVNSNNSKVRQRFTIGHELGHLTLHPGHDLILERLVRLNFRDATSSTASDEEEIEANRFAAELLMPQNLLQSSLSILLQGRRLSDLDRSYLAPSRQHDR